MWAELWQESRVTCWVNATEKHFEIWQKGETHQVNPDQRLVWSDDALRGVCGVDAREKHAPNIGSICAPIPG
jgi:hypothetical protein